MTKVVQYVLISLVFIASACATYTPQYADAEAKPQFPKGKTIEKTFYLVGDAGISPADRPSDALVAFRKYISDENEDTKGDYTLFLGDNIYPDGLPPENDPLREISEYYLDAQIESLQEFQGETYFIPGNHEYYSGGIEGVLRQQAYIQENLDKNAFQPTNGCPLQSFAVSDNIQLILIDSQWYLEDWNRNPIMNRECEIKSREKFFIELELELNKNRNKTVVFAMHHPMFTNGTHGGYYALKKHLYPTQRKIPLPGLASLVAQVRAQGGVSVQDRYNELYNKFMIRLSEVAKAHGRMVFTSGHEHTLQHIEKEGLIQIVSGSGAKQGYAALGEDGLFSYGGQGFAVLNVFTDGSSYVRYYGVDAELNPKLLFEKKLYAPYEYYGTNNLPSTFEPTVTVPIYEQDSLTQTLFFQTVWGEKYRSAYGTPIEASVAQLDTLYGGLTVLREASESSFKTLRLRDARGNEYRMRSLKKNALQYTQELPQEQALEEGEKLSEGSKVDLPDSFNEQFYTASHPYSILAIGRLAEAAELFHNEPQLFYVPKQKALGNYNNDFGNELYVISLLPTESSEGESNFQYPDDVETTDDILLKLRQGREIALDEEAYIKNRLFDMLIGDWDREPDHWRWAEYFRADSVNVYVPISRSRNDAFSSMEGTVIDLASSIFGNNYRRHLYNQAMPNVAWFNEEGVKLDRALLQGSGKPQWQFLAAELQQQISDRVIDAAFEAIPSEVRDESLEDIKAALRQRRESLVEIAGNYYDYLSSLQTFVGTDGPDYFEILRQKDGSITIREFAYKEGEAGTLFTERTVTPEQTKEVWVYGLDGNDSFRIEGEDRSPILVRVIGGHGDDTYQLINGSGTKVYDHESLPNTIAERYRGNIRFTDVYNLNTYEYRKQISKTHLFNAAAGYNPDDGFRLGGQYAYELNSFTQNPFSQKHVVNAGYYFDTRSFDVLYEGEFANIKNDLNLHIGARITSPNYIENYFGYGNETANFQDALGYDANRVEIQRLSAEGALVRNSSFGSFFKLQGKAESVTINSPITGSTNPGNETRPEETDYFATVEGIYSYRSYDDPRNPRQGMMFDLNVGVTDNLQDIDRVFGYLNTRLGFYNSLIKNKKLVLRTNVRGQFNFGNRFEFYQGVRLGANNGLRGFREERFTGKSSLVGSADVRYSFDEFNISLVPVQIGVYGGADLGRVWTPSGNSQRWHNDYGGGLWINGRGGMSITASYFRSTEGKRIVFGLGFDF